jgi:hypothetical protein
LKTEYTHLAARELGSLYVKALSGAYLRHKHEWTLTKIDFQFRPTLISYPFSHREMHSIQTHTEKGHGHETQKPTAATPRRKEFKKIRTTDTPKQGGRKKYCKQRNYP